MLLKNPVQRGVDALPFGEQRLQNGFALRGEAIKAFVAFVFFAPFADQEALGFEAAQQRVESAFVEGMPWSARDLRRV